MKVQICKTLLEPQEIKVASSKGDGTYYHVTTATLYNDPVCECPGFTHRGMCRHIEELEPTCGWVEQITNDRYLGEPCPVCGSETQEYETEPEL